MVKVKLKKLNPNASVPTRATQFAGGWDVTATEIIQKEDDLVICKLGFALEIPLGYKLSIVPRSSITNTKWVLQNSPGLGDCDYRGEYQVRFRAFPIDFGKGDKTFTYQQFPYKVGERIAQVYIEEVVETEFEVVDELEDTNRGDGGFGSTGK